LGDQADEHPPTPPHRGFRSAQFMWLLSQVLWNNGRREEAGKINTEGRRRLRETIRNDPYLSSANHYLGLTNLIASYWASQDWNFAKVQELIQEGQSAWEQKLKLDPKSIYSRHDYAVTWTERRFYVDFQRRDFVAAEFDIRTGLVTIQHLLALRNEIRHLT
jgi:hypothetical protein